MIAGCGHEIDFPFPSRNVICKPCFEAQGFTYNRNTYSDIDDKRKRAGMRPAVTATGRRKRVRSLTNRTHGITGTYGAGCRCEPCRLAHSAYNYARYHGTAA